MNTTPRALSYSALSLMLIGCSTGIPADQQSAPEEAAAISAALTTTHPKTTRAFAIESQVAGLYPLGDICVLYLFADGDYTGLVVSQDQSGPALCGALQPYLGGDDRLLEWVTAEAQPITDQNALQNLATAFDQSSGRTVDYYTLTGNLREWLWGTVYGNGQVLPTQSGDRCALIVETDAGDTIGLTEPVDSNNSCPHVGLFLNNFYLVKIRDENTQPITDAALLADLDAGYPGWTIEWRQADAPVRLLFTGSLGGTFDGETFTDEQAIATLELANNGSYTFLDDEVPLHKWAVNSITQGRPITTMSQLAGLWWVGPSALRHLRDFECPAGSHFEDDGFTCVPDAPALLPFGGDCLGQGGAACQSGLCTTSWDGYFCYYTACTATCQSTQDCENAAIAAGFAPQDVQGNMWCGNGVCDLTYLQAGGQSCE